MKLSERVLRWMGQQACKPSGLLGQRAGHGMSWGHRSHTAWALGYLDVRPTDRGLDIGCGGGMAIKLIAGIAVDGFVAGIDHSPGMVEQACRRNAAAIRAGRVEIAHGTVAALPYDDASFAGFSQAWFESAPNKGVGWLCALARK